MASRLADTGDRGVIARVWRWLAARLSPVQAVPVGTLRLQPTTGWCRSSAAAGRWIGRGTS